MDALCNVLDNAPGFGNRIDGKKNGSTKTSSYAWNVSKGQKGSSTQNITGVYDLSGCVREWVSALITNGSTNLDNYGSPLTPSSGLYAQKISGQGNLLCYDSTYYLWCYGMQYSNNKVESNQNNYEIYEEKSTLGGFGYGDAILETSIAGTGCTSWFDDNSVYPSGDYPFFSRSGTYEDRSWGGYFAFQCEDGSASCDHGFRAVLNAK